jgi:hypothetical protein
MGIPQIIMIVLHIISLMLVSHWHGRERVVKHNAFQSIFAMIIIQALLYWGGWYH